MIYPLAICGGLHRHLDHRHLLRAARRQQLDHGRALPRLHRHRRAFGRRLVGGDAFRARRLRRGRHRGGDDDHRAQSVPVRHRRAAGHRLHRVDHRVLHGHRLSPGALDQPGVRHGPRDQRDPRSRGLAGGDRAAGARHRRRHSVDVLARRACSERRSPPRRCWGLPASWSRSTPSGRSPTMRAASRRWRACPRRCAARPTRSMPSATRPRPSPRAMPSARRDSARWCCLPPTATIFSTSSTRPTRRARRRSHTSAACTPISRWPTLTSWSGCCSAASSPTSSAAWR